MKKYLLGRILEAIISLLAVSFIIFLLSRLAGDPLNLLLDASATHEDKALLASKLGLDKPMMEQYWIFIIISTRFPRSRNALNFNILYQHLSWEEKNE